MPAFLVQFAHDPRVLTLLGLIVLDAVLGVSEALQSGTFEWRKLPEFYRSMVLPYVLGYLAAYGATLLVVEDWAGGFAAQSVVTLLWAAPIGNLLRSITGHLKALGVRTVSEQTQ
jgi:hypothetical protein